MTISERIYGLGKARQRPFVKSFRARWLCKACVALKLELLIVLNEVANAHKGRQRSAAPVKLFSRQTKRTQQIRALISTGHGGFDKLLQSIGGFSRRALKIRILRVTLQGNA